MDIDYLDLIETPEFFSYTEGDDCPDCDDGKLVKRLNRGTGEDFLGCSNYPKCEFSQSIITTNKILR